MADNKTELSPKVTALFECVDKLLEFCEQLLEYVHVKLKTQAPSPVYSYPVITKFDSGLPHITREYTDKSPPDWENFFSGMGFFSVGLSSVPEDYLTKFPDFLEAFNKAFPVGNNDLGEPYSASFREWNVKSMAQGVVCNFLHSYGVIPYDESKMLDAAEPFISRWSDRVLQLTLMVPICLTHFDFDQFYLGDKNYICRIPEAIQKSRWRIEPLGSGVEKVAADAATHAFVSSTWYLETDNRDELYSALHHFGAEATDLVDLFMASLRLATGAETGYGQILYVPRKWAYSPSGGLPDTFGKYTRRYPSSFDSHGWVRHDLPRVSRDQMKEVRETFRLVRTIKQKKIPIAIRRLNSALTRDEDDDAILDAIIGLEVLLLDKEPQALSYKLRM